MQAKLLSGNTDSKVQRSDTKSDSSKRLHPYIDDTGSGRMRFFINIADPMWMTSGVDRSKSKQDIPKTSGIKPGLTRPFTNIKKSTVQKSGISSESPVLDMP